MPGTHEYFCPSVVAQSLLCCLCKACGRARAFTGMYWYSNASVQVFRCVTGPRTPTKLAFPRGCVGDLAHVHQCTPTGIMTPGLRSERCPAHGTFESGKGELRTDHDAPPACLYICSLPAHKSITTNTNSVLSSISLINQQCLPS